MEKVFEFIVNHWVLCAAFVLILLMLIGSEIRQKMHGMKKLGVHDFVQLMNNEKIVILDIRTEKEFKQGHIQGAINLPFSQVGKGVAKVLAKNKGHLVVIVDQMGYQATAAGAMVTKQGLGPVNILDGGMNGWDSANMPVVK